MISMTTKRIYELKKGDLFIMIGTLYKVLRIDNRYIYYSYVRYENSPYTHGPTEAFGCFNQAQVEIVGNRIDKPNIRTL